jgi:hypothetical protein
LSCCSAWPKTERHLLLLTATPHSGDEVAFYNLLSLLDPAFVGLQNRTSADDPLREQLARHFVQRRRKDIVEWQAETQRRPGLCPPHENRAHLQAHRRLGRLFSTPCKPTAVKWPNRWSKRSQGSARLIWYATLALLRCVASPGRRSQGPDHPAGR